MNINEMNLDQASDAMLRVSNALGFIFQDEEVCNLLDDISASESTSIMKWIPKYLPRIAAMVLQRHRDSMYEIIGALSQTDTKKVGKMNFREVVEILRDNWETLMSFFPSTAASAGTNVTQLS